MSKALFNISRFIAILLSIIYTFVLIDSYALRPGPAAPAEAVPRTVPP